MKRTLILTGMLALAIVWIGCSQVTDPQEPVPATAGLDTEQLAAEIVRNLNWPVAADEVLPAPDKARPNAMHEFDREVIVGDIAHYSLEIQIGDHPFDRIGLHRVVREARPWVPERSHDAIMLLHGDGAPFVTAFLLSTLSDAIPDDHSAAVYLAQQGIDVWGIDLAWTHVPVETTDFGFLADWGLQKDVDDLNTALATARTVRRLTGNGWLKMHLLGWSRGVWVGSALLNQETQVPPGHRNVKGFIPVDGWYKTDDEALRASNCETVAALQAQYDAGEYVDATGVFGMQVVAAATSAPDAPQEFFPGLPHTNLQFALAIGTSTYELFGMPWTYHLIAGVFDDEGLPAGAQFVPTQAWLDFLGNWAPYQSLLQIIEAEAIVCDDPAWDLPYDDYLDEITVPILYVGAAGGFGELGEYTTTLYGSTDVTTHIVQLYPDDQSALDFAHVDLFNADNADELVWPTVADWVFAHGDNSGR